MKKKLLLVSLIVVALVCLFAISASAAAPTHFGKEIDVNATVTLDDKTVLRLFDDEGNALIWYVDANSETGYSSIRADEKTWITEVNASGQEVIKGFDTTKPVVDYQVNSWASSVHGVMAHQVDKVVITDANGNNVPSSNIVVFNIMDDDVVVTTSKQSNAPVGSNVNSITSIFKSNANLEYAYLRLDTNSIQGNTFFMENGTSKLKYVNLEDLTQLKRINAYAFRNCKVLFKGQILDLTRTSLVDFSGDGVFAYVPMTGILLPSTFTSFGSNWCLQGTGITSITIPASVTTISQNTFKECNSLTSVTIPKTVNTIGANAFWKCQNLVTVTFEERNGAALTFSGAAVFENCYKLKRLEIPEGVTALPNCFANNCKALEYIYLPTTLTNCLINNSDNNHFAYAGVNAEKIEIVGLEKTQLTAIPSAMFRGVSKWDAETLVLPNTVKSINGSYAFADTPFKTVYLGAAMETISTESFVNCPNLKVVYMPDTINEIVSSAFNNSKTNNILFVVTSSDTTAEVFGVVKAATGAADTYVSYADFLKIDLNNYNGGRQIVYGANKCEIFYDGKHKTAPIEGNPCLGECSICKEQAIREDAAHVYAWIFNDGNNVSLLAQITAKHTCQFCKTVEKTELIEAIFENYGSSSSMIGVGVHQKTKVNEKALERYAKLTGNENVYNYGIFAGVAVDRDGTEYDGDLVSVNGTAVSAKNSEKSVVASFANTDYTILTIKITGVAAGDQIYFGTFATVGNNVTYVTGNTEGNKAEAQTIA